MFCLYCGTKLPDDSFFCNVCGRRQRPLENTSSAMDVNVIAMPPLSSTLVNEEWQPDVNTLIQATPSTLEDASKPSYTAANTVPPDAPSVDLSSIPASSEKAVQPDQPATLTVHPHAESSLHAHALHAQTLAESAKITGHISRRAALLLGLTGGAAVVVAGSGITWSLLSKKHSPPPTAIIHTSNTPASTSNTQAPTSSPEVPPAAVVSLEYSTNLDHWGINYNRPSAISLSTTPPSNNWTLPPSRGVQRLFGTLSFGDNLQVGAVVDRLSDISANNHYYDAEVVFNFSGGTDFSNQPTYTSNGSGSQPVEFPIHYPDGSQQTFAIAIYTDGGINNGNPDYVLSYYRACARQGTARLDGVDYPIAITSENNDGIYSNLDSVDITLDLNGNGTFEDGEHFSASKPFVFKGTTYAIRSITPDGSSMIIIKA